MPINNNKEPRQIPVKIGFGVEPDSKFVNLVNNIRVELNYHATILYEDVKKYAIDFALATYADWPNQYSSDLLWDNVREDKVQRERIADLIMYKIFKRELLPATLETIRLNFVISGITIQEVTHILRYRKVAFSAECSGEKWWSWKAFCVPTAIENSSEFYDRYKKICEDSKKLYADMIDSEEISLRDARYILPRATETFYFMSMNLADAIGFIYDRIDEQIQPEADNVIALKMLNCLIGWCPILVKVFGKDLLSKPAKYYVNSANKTFGSNLYPPDKNNDCFEYNEVDFIYDKTRDKFCGTDETWSVDAYKEIKRSAQNQLDRFDTLVDSQYGVGFFDKDVTLDDIYGKDR